MIKYRWTQKKNLTTIKLFRKEQGKMEANLIRIINGEIIIVPKIKHIDKDSNISLLVSGYKRV